MEDNENLVLKNAVASCQPTTNNELKGNTLKYAIVVYINGYNYFLVLKQVEESSGLHLPRSGGCY